MRTRARAESTRCRRPNIIGAEQGGIDAQNEPYPKGKCTFADDLSAMAIPADATGASGPGLGGLHISPALSAAGCGLLRLRHPVDASALRPPPDTRGALNVT